MSEKVNLEAAKRVQWILWFALMMSQFVYLGVLFIVTQDPGFREGMEAPEDLTMMRIALSVVALSIVVVVTPLMRKILYFGPASQGKLAGPKPALQQLVTTNLITWALCESAAIMGFVQGFLLADPMVYLPFLALGVVGMIFWRPQVEAHLTVASGGQ